MIDGKMTAHGAALSAAIGGAVKAVDLLKRAREQQIAAMEGRAVKPVKAPKRVCLLPEPAKETLPAYERLRFTDHARMRMAQRGMTHEVIYAIYRSGEVFACTVGQSRQGGQHHVVTQKALDAAMMHDRQMMAPHAGEAIVVAKDRTDGGPVVITVLAFGQDSRVSRYRRGRSKHE